MGSSARDRSPDPVFEELACQLAELRSEALGFARRLVGRSGRPDPEDVVHSAMANVLSRLGDLEDPTALRSYLFTAIANIWRNQVQVARRQAFEPYENVAAVPSSDATPEERFFGTVDNANARRAFEQLSTTAQAIIWMRFVDGLSSREIAAELGMNEAAVRQRVHRARLKLRDACLAFETAPSKECSVCSKTDRRWLDSYMRGRLSAGRSRRVEAHLAACIDCRIWYANAAADLDADLPYPGNPSQATS